MYNVKYPHTYILLFGLHKLYSDAKKQIGLNQRDIKVLLFHNVGLFISGTVFIRIVCLLIFLGKIGEVPFSEEWVGRYD